MTNHTFHTKKEEEAKILNFVAQTVKSNNFPDDTKAKVLKLTNEVITKINNCRIKVYKELEGFDYVPGDYDHTAPNLESAARILAENESITKLQHDLATQISVLENDIFKETIEPIVSEMDFKTFLKEKDFKFEHHSILQDLEDMKDIISKEIETPVSTTTDDNSMRKETQEEEEKRLMAQMEAEDAVTQEAVKELDQKGITDPEERKSFLDKLFGK